MNKKHNLLDSFVFAIEGIKFAVIHNRNMRIHLIVAILVVVFSYLLHISIFEAGLVGIMILLVIATEMINTVVEEIVNMLTKEYMIEAKIAKDVSAGTVLLTSLVSIVIGVLVFLPHILEKLF